MLLRLIKTRPMISGSHAVVWEINPILGDRLLGEVFVLNEHLPSELIYRLAVTVRGLSICGRECGWQWIEREKEIDVWFYLRDIQATREEIYVEVCVPEPDLPGYPKVDYHPDDFPIVLLDDLSEDEKPEEPIEIPEYA